MRDTAVPSQARNWTSTCVAVLIAGSGATGGYSAAASPSAEKPCSAISRAGQAWRLSRGYPWASSKAKAGQPAMIRLVVQGVAVAMLAARLPTVPRASADQGRQLSEHMFDR